MPTLDTRTPLTTPAVADLIHVQDVSDATDTVNGTSKKVTLDDIQTFMNTEVNAKPIVLNGDTGNAPWRVQSSNAHTGADFIADQVLYFLYNTEYDHPNSAWKARDVNGLPVVRYGFESNWQGNLEWNLDVAPAGTGVPTFGKRLYGLEYSYGDNVAVWQWRSKTSPSIGTLWDMMLDDTNFQIGSSFNVVISSGAISIGNTVGTGSPVANRTIQLNAGGSTYYLLASTSSG